MRYDAIIVGGGPAGLSAAVILARCCRSVLVLDAGRPRNYAAMHVHNFLTRDGVPPARLLELGRAEVESYGGQFRRGVVTSGSCEPDGFTIHLEGDQVEQSRTLLLATGVSDVLPAISNVAEFYGHGVHHCPYCDAWEVRDKPLAAFGEARAGLGLALSLLTWSPQVTIVSNGQPLTAEVRRRARQAGVGVREEKIVRLETERGMTRPGDGDPMGRIVFESGPPLPVAAMFFNTDKVQRSNLAMQLGCKLNREGGVMHDRKQRTGVRGLYLAGDASFDVQFVIVAAAEGAKAGVAMNRDLQDWNLAIAGDGRFSARSSSSELSEAT